MWSVLMYATVTRPQEHPALLSALDHLQASTRSGGARVTAQFHSGEGVKRYYLENGIRRIEERQAAGFNELETLRELIDSDGDAEHRALLVYGHGYGIGRVYRLQNEAWNKVLMSIKSHADIGPDVVTGAFLANKDLRAAIATSNHVRMDLLALNACSLAMLEVANELREVSALQISSQVDAEIWPYDSLAAALTSAPASAEELAAAIVGSVADKISRNERYDAISVIRSDKVLPVVEAFQKLAELALPLVVLQGRDFLDVIAGARRVYDPYQRDLVSLVRRLARFPELSAAARDVEHALDEARIASVAHVTHDVHGLSVYCPLDRGIVVEQSYGGEDFESWALLLAKLNELLPDSPFAPQ